MANPEHVEIVKAGKEAIEKWWGGAPKEIARGILEPPRKDLTLDLRDADLEGIVLQEVCLRGAQLQRANLVNANLRATDLQGANLTSAGLIQAYLEGANLMQAILEYTNLARSDLTGTFLTGANLRGAHLSGARLLIADLEGADLSGANVTMAQFSGANLKKAKLDGIILGDTGTDGWNIEQVSCSYFFIESLYTGKSDNKRQRVPKTGALASGEFEQRFKTRPTIEFLFKEGMPALGPAILDAAIGRVNEKKPQARLKLLAIDGRGVVPRAIIEIAEDMPKESALKLVVVSYETVTGQMQKEIEELKLDKKSLLQTISRNMLLPGVQNKGLYASVQDIASRNEIDPEALRKRLERARRQNLLTSDFYIENEYSGSRQPRYVYAIDKVMPIVMELKNKQTSGKRPAK